MDKQYYYCLKTFFVFLGVIYLPGLLYYPFFQDGYHKYFNYSGDLYSNFFIISVTFSIFVFISFWALSKLPYLRVPSLNSRLTIVIFIVIITLFFIFSIYFFTNFSSSFRHKNRLSDAGGMVTILFLLKPLIYFLVALMLIHVLNGHILGRVSRFLLLLILVSTLLFLNSSLQFIIVPVILIILYSPNLLVTRLSNIKIRYILFAFFLVPVLCLTVVFIGVGNKLGYEFLLSEQGLSYLKGFGNVLFPRMSTSLFSSVIIFENSFDGIAYSDKVIEGISSTLSNRLSLFFPGENFNSDLISTVNRLNYMDVFNSHAERAGASPGIISSVFFIPFFPFSFFVIPIYIALIFKAIRYHMGPELRMNLLSMLILSYLIISLFEAPVNIFYLVDPSFFLFITVTLLSRFINIKDVFSK